ncbi:hypothetical protein, partial [Escherichia coli]|uniref:hypothetical protein n=1 Tax=Escherichia coli TaxID=562 RepID=UPI001CCD77DF
MVAEGDSYAYGGMGQVHFGESASSNEESEKLEDVEWGPFNDRAANLANEYSFDEVIAMAKQHRQQIIEWLEGLDETEWTKPFNIGEHVLTLKEYFSDFVWHDT